MLVGAPRGARCIAKHLIVRSNPDIPPGAIRALRLVGAPTPSIGGYGRRGMRANPWPEDTNRGDMLLTQGNSVLVAGLSVSEIRDDQAKLLRSSRISLRSIRATQGNWLFDNRRVL